MPPSQIISVSGICLVKGENWFPQVIVYELHASEHMHVLRNIRAGTHRQTNPRSQVNRHIHMYIFIYVHTLASVHRQVPTQVQTGTYLHIQAHTFLSTHTHTHTHTHTSAHIHLHTWQLSIFLFVYFMYMSTLQWASDGITDGCEPMCGCWELNSGPLKVQSAISLASDK